MRAGETRANDSWADLLKKRADAPTLVLRYLHYVQVVGANV